MIHQLRASPGVNGMLLFSLLDNLGTLAKLIASLKEDVT